jgi:hypothetical protein
VIAWTAGVDRAGTKAALAQTLARLLRAKLGD